MDFLNHDNTFTDTTTDFTSGLDYTDPMTSNSFDQSIPSFNDGLASMDNGLTPDAMGQSFHENVVSDAMRSILETPDHFSSASVENHLTFHSSPDIPIPLPVTIVKPYSYDMNGCSTNTSLLNDSQSDTDSNSNCSDSSSSCDD